MPQHTLLFSHHTRKGQSRGKPSLLVRTRGLRGSSLWASLAAGVGSEECHSPLQPPGPLGQTLES